MTDLHANTIPDAELYQVTPREQVGAATGARYDFQYHQAAADSLRVLDDTQVACVYCEWHDDYVLELAGVVSYQFHQVKSRSSSQGPWKTNEFFGVAGRRPRTAAAQAPAPLARTDSVFGRFYDHYRRFGSRCSCFVFVTDAGITPAFQTLVDSVASADDQSALSGDCLVEFSRIHRSLKTVFTELTEGDLFAFICALHVQPAVGTIADLSLCRALIGGRILDMSEVDLTVSQSRKIGAELVSAVRERSHRVLDSLPESLEALRAAKGLVLDDILKILSLSSAGYRELRAGGQDAVKTLSRIHRLLRRSNVPESSIPDFCKLKAGWDAWWVTQRHIVSSLDQMALSGECSDALRVHADDRLDFRGLRQQASTLAARYKSILTSTEPLTDELVFGLMLALAVEAEQ